jgi:uncharacterized protein (DUF1501 family)
MSKLDFNRRGLLKAGGALSVFGAAGPFVLQLAAAGVASAQTPSSYKALVCLYLYGGNDGHNTVLATDADSWGRYFATRNAGFDPIALMPVGTPPVPAGSISPVTGRVSVPTSPEFWGGVLPITPSTPQPIPAGTNATVRTFALHPFMAPMQSLFSQGRLAIVANIGPMIQPITKAQYLAGTVPTPQSLFSHFDQQGAWQGGTLQSSRVGWGGAMADLVLGTNGANSVFTAIAPSGGSQPGGLSLYLAGQTARRYSISTGRVPADVIQAVQARALFKAPGGPAVLSGLIQNTSSTSAFANDYAPIVTRSINAAGLVNGAVAQGAAAQIPSAPNYVNPFTGYTIGNPVAQQLEAVARQVAAAGSLGLSRQVFFITLPAFDTHANQNSGQPDLLGQVAQGLAYFDSVLSNIGGVDYRGAVTTFTMSDFGRTFSTNGSGTDHGWGSHAFVMGGAVNGGNIYGQYPTLGIDLGGFTNPDMAGNNLVPTISVDQYAATLGTWFGVSPADLTTIFPNLQYFAPSTLGFI